MRRLAQHKTDMKHFPKLLLATAVVFASCSNDDDNTTPMTDDDQGMDPMIEAPLTYNFERNGETTVSFSGQTTRILMAEELVDDFKDFDNATEAAMLAKYTHEEGQDNFENADLNASDKNIRSKTAASRDYFSANATEATAIKDQFEQYINVQITEVFPNELVAAAPGVAGQIADGSSTRYVTGQGLEMDQAFTKGLMGALMADQMLNNYLGEAVLDEGDNRANNDEGVLAEGKNYTTMEHKWDEAYGYLFGTSQNLANPLPTVGDDDSFLNKYLGRVEGDADFAGIAQEIYDAFKLGRAAIVGGDYDLRDEQADIIQQKVSEIIAIRAVYYLQQGKNGIEAEDFGAAFHDISEGWGFIYSLRFTRNPSTDDTYFTRAEVDGILEALLADGANGLWDVTPATLDTLSEQIAAKFSFTVAQAGSTD